jgi:uncharacterized protein
MDNAFFTVITGASTGMGRAFAKEFASRKHDLVLSSLPDEGLQQLGREIEESYKVKVFCFETDLTETDGPQSLFEFVRDKNLKVNILVNNAGIGFDGPIENYSVADIDRMILLNIRALTHLTYFFTTELKSHPRSYILFLGSFGSFLPTAYKSVYLATKSYIFYLSRALRSEFRDSSLKTCILVPSAVRTNKHTLDRIKRGGWAGQASALSPEDVAAVGVRGLFKGRKVIIPGTLTNIFFTIGQLVPEGIVLWLTHRIFSNHKFRE